MKVMLCICITLLAICSQTFAATCPTQFQQHQNGFWYSQQKPSWKSVIKTPKNITLSAKDFGGVVYSVKHSMLACIYKASNGNWIPLVSKPDKKIKIDLTAKDDNGKATAWRFNPKKKDFACGAPFVKNLKGCQFKL